ncbi:hypothetical protein NXF25_013056 [Crotalus adamanteus]|uniref:Uncharacterized protein n=1 Tax=Crotalus adamanteus TaxID=8729 RepID=A0AAW1BE08_CROAD
MKSTGGVESLPTFLAFQTCRFGSKSFTSPISPLLSNPAALCSIGKLLLSVSFLRRDREGWDKRS